MSECKYCGAEVGAEEGTCPSCGARLEGGTLSFPTVMGTDAELAEEPGGLKGPILVVQKGPEVGERFTLDRPFCSVGRDAEADIFLSDVTVSRSHAEITVEGDEVTIRDVGSLNGTYVNGIRVDEARLTHGDVVQIGRFQMIFLAEGVR